MTPAVLCQGLRKVYGSVVAVEKLDLEIRRGECFGLLGPNGAGKTTTIEILEGLTIPDAGRVEILGMRWEQDAVRIRPRLGVQLQETRLTEKQRVEEAVRLFRSFYRDGPSVDELINLVQLGEKRRTYVKELSGGQRQRLSVACALAGNPDILFLDEPTTGLDPQSRRGLWDVCEEFRHQGGTILLTTHFMDEAEKLADRVAIMDHGKFLVQGTPRELIDTLGGAQVIEFKATVPLELAELQTLPGVRRVDERDSARLLTVNELHRTVPALLALLGRKGGDLASLHTHRATLDDVFLARTGRGLRDD
ncbi:MAG: ABC transporter ATP-binding protein [Longimicrobiaceae bacterium]